MSEVTRDSLVAEYLFGLTLTSDGTASGTPFPDALFDNAIASAYATVGTELGLQLEPIIIDGSDDPDRPYEMRNAQGWHGSERHDFNRDLFDRFKLRQHPVRRVRRVVAFFPTSRLFEFPVSSIQLRDAGTGVIRLIPNTDWALVLSQYIPTSSALAQTAYRDKWPDYIRVDYEAGFHPTEYPLPRDLRHYLSLAASFNILNPAGDLVVGAGIASKSFSFDGFSQTVNTTSSAENSAYSSRLIQYRKEMNVLRGQLQARYAGINFGVV